MAETDRNADAAADTGATEAGTAPDRRRWHYPVASEHPDRDIYVHEPWCKSCGICYSICPRGVLEGDRAGRPIVVHPEKCVACYLCEILCPDMAVTVHKEPPSKAKKASGEGEAAGGNGDE
jgi:2-oxoglutarate ferredoxin oxidoreductase subunit delta